MTVRTNLGLKSGLFFITFTCYGWMNLFEKVNGYDIVYKWFDHLKTKGHFICAYVIMPNHVHALTPMGDSAGT